MMFIFIPMLSMVCILNKPNAKNREDLTCWFYSELNVYNIYNKLKNMSTTLINES